MAAEQRDIRSYYERYDEQGRLARGFGALEFARMQDLIGRFLAPPPAVVLDVGGGPELAAETGESGFRRKGLFTVQGPAQFAPDLDTRMADPVRRAQLLDLIRLVEQEETLLGAASHIALVAEKPTQDT